MLPSRNMHFAIAPTPAHHRRRLIRLLDSLLRCLAFEFGSVANCCNLQTDMMNLSSRLVSALKDCI